MIIIRAILSWVSQGRNPIDHLLFQLTEPLMAPIRRVIPAMGRIRFLSHDCYPDPLCP